MASSFQFHSSICRHLFEFLSVNVWGCGCKPDVINALQLSLCVWSAELCNWYTLDICTGLWANNDRVDGWRRKASLTRTPVGSSDYVDRCVTESVFHIQPCNWWLLIHSRHLGLVVPQPDRFRRSNRAFPAGLLLEFKHKLFCPENNGREQGRVGDQWCSKQHFGRNMMGLRDKPSPLSSSEG